MYLGDPTFDPLTTAQPTNATPTAKVLPVSSIATYVSCALSLVGSLTIIFTYIAIKEIRTLSRRLLVFLSVADFLSAGGFLYGTIRNFTGNTLDCRIQGGVISFGQTCSFFWTASVTVYLYLTIVKADIQFAAKLYKYFHLVSWGVPLVIVAFAGGFGGLGYDSSTISVGWCWIDLENKNYLMWMLLTCKLWEFISYITIPLLCILTKIHIYKKSKYKRTLSARAMSVQSDTLDALTKVDHKLTFIPSVFLLLRIWGSIRFVMYLCNSEALSDPTLMTLHGIGNSFQGGANCILYCLLTTKIRKKLTACLLSFFRCEPCKDSQCCPYPDPCTKADFTPHEDCNCACLPCCRRKRYYVQIKSLDYYDQLNEATKLVDSQ